MRVSAPQSGSMADGDVWLRNVDAVAEIILPRPATPESPVLRFWRVAGDSEAGDSDAGT